MSAVARRARFQAVRLAVRMRDRTRQVRVPTPGTNHRLYARTGTSDLAAFQSVTDELRELVLPEAPRTILDLGANVGYASAALALRYPDARLVAVEPEPSNAALLRRNVRGLNVAVVEAAVWPRSGRLAMEDPGKGRWGYRVREGGAHVRAVTVDELMRDAGFDTVDLVKIDIEGAEYELFSENTGWLSAVRTLMIEFHDRFRAGASAAVETGIEEHWGAYERFASGEKAVFRRPETSG